MTWEHCGVSFVLFRTGMAVLTGAKNFETLQRANESAKSFLKNYELLQETEDLMPALLSRELRVDRGREKRSQCTIAERKEEMRLASFKKQEMYYLKRMRERYDSVEVKTAPTKKKPRKAKALPSVPIPTETSYRWNTIDSMTTVMQTTERPTPGVRPIQTLMIGLPPQLLARPNGASK